MKLVRLVIHVLQVNVWKFLIMNARVWILTSVKVNIAVVTEVVTIQQIPTWALTLANINVRVYLDIKAMIAIRQKHVKKVLCIITQYPSEKMVANVKMELLLQEMCLTITVYAFANQGLKASIVKWILMNVPLSVVGVIPPATTALHNTRAIVRQDGKVVELELFVRILMNVNQLIVAVIPHV